MHESVLFGLYVFTKIIIGQCWSESYILLHCVTFGMCVIVISDWLHSLWLHNWIHLSLKRETQFWHLPRHVTAFFDRRWFVLFWIRCEEVPYSHPMSNSLTKFTKGNVCLHVNLEFVNEFNSQASSSIFPQSFWNVWVWRIAVTEQLNLLKNCSYYWIYWTIEQLNLLKPPVLWTCCWFQLCADTLGLEGAFASSALTW